MTTYHALQILAANDAPMSVEEMNEKAVDQIDVDTLMVELDAAQREGLVTYRGGVWTLTDAGRDQYS